MRGKDDLQKLFAVFFGITPAYAGKSRSGIYLASVLQDHPRLCGEKVLEVLRHMPLPGSPPPMRGKAVPDTVVSYGSRITPAYAGKSLCGCFRARYGGDHPRLCGEKSATTSGGISGSGSPPPMRGKASQKAFFPHVQRITPAYAGKSCEFVGIAEKSGDHPRLCGEKSCPTGYATITTGSPPPMRGKGFYPVLQVKPTGITPAYAGKRSGRTPFYFSF